MYIRLSYDISESTPYPAGLWPVKIDHVHDMAKGRVSNVYMVTLCNHVGTHIDGPNHFCKDKKALNKFALDSFIFHKPLLLDIPKTDGGLVTAEDLKHHIDAIKRCDLLLIRTGFGKIRRQDVKRYADKSPGFAASAGQYIVDEFPHLRALGMDTLSFACPQHLDEGIKAHQILMDECKCDIFLLEDINLDYDLSRLTQVLTIPLFCEYLDSAPCTVLAVTE
jgi:arylformamidase